jgi:hypothetical protein
VLPLIYHARVSPAFIHAILDVQADKSAAVRQQQRTERHVTMEGREPTNLELETISAC